MKISKQEKIILTYIFDGIDSYVVTRNILGKYTLYKIINDDYQKIKTADSAVDFDKIVQKDRSN